MKMIFAYLVVAMCMSGFVAFSQDDVTKQRSDLPPLSKDQILALLPPGCSMADDIPSTYSLRLDALSYAKSYYWSDIDSDGAKELILAYYTERDAYLPGGDMNEAFLNRSHVRVYRKNEIGYEAAWDSGGWGYQFRVGLNPDLDIKIKNSFAECFFRVQDINADGIPDICFTRCGTDAMGSKFEVWSWSSKSKELVKIADASKGRFEDIDQNGVREIICDYIPRKQGIEPSILWWDNASFRYKESGLLNSTFKAHLHQD